MKLEIYNVIQAPQITEKSTIASEKLRQYTLQVHKASNKKQIKSAVEKIFNVHVLKVRVMNNRGKWRRVRYRPGLTPDWKKAIVTLKEGEKIDFTA